MEHGSDGRLPDLASLPAPFPHTSLVALPLVPQRHAEPLPARPSIQKVETTSCWEVSVDESNGRVKGVRIYLPENEAISRAYSPMPIRIYGSSGIRRAKRWINEVFDAHFTLMSMERRILSGKDTGRIRLVREVGLEVDALYQSAYDALAEWHIGNLTMVAGKLDDASRLTYTHPLEFIAAIGTPKDTRFLQLIVRFDSGMSVLDAGYLMEALPQERFVERQMEAERVIDGASLKALELIRRFLREHLRRN